MKLTVSCCVQGSDPFMLTDRVCVYLKTGCRSPRIVNGSTRKLVLPALKLVGYTITRAKPSLGTLEMSLVISSSASATASSPYTAVAAISFDASPRPTTKPNSNTSPAEDSRPAPKSKGLTFFHLNPALIFKPQ